MGIGVEVFIGEVYLPGYGIVPLFTSPSRLQLTGSDIRRFTALVRSAGLRGAYVSDGTKLYHRVYTSTIVVSGAKTEVKPVDELLTSFEESKRYLLGSQQAQDPEHLGRLLHLHRYPGTRRTSP